MTYFRYKIDVKKSNSLSVYQQDTIYMDTILKEIKLIKKKKNNYLGLKLTIIWKNQKIIKVYLRT